MSTSRPYNPPIRAGGEEGRWFMIALSIFLHIVLVTGVVAFARVGLPEFDQGFRISVAEVPLRTSDLPPLRDNREAGMPTREAEQAPAVTRPEPETEPEKEESKPEPEPEKPVETAPKPEPKKTEPKQTIVPTRTKPVEKKPEPEGPTPQEVARELESRRAVYTARRNVGGTNVSRIVAAESDPGAGGGPALYRSVLIARIGELWSPPFTRRGEVRDALVEFTIYSPPLPRDAVNRVRTSQVSNIRLVKSSGDVEFDSSALSAVRKVRQWPPLPDSYRKETLVVQCRFYLIGEDQ